MSRFRFIDAGKTNHPVRMMCRLLNVSLSGSYDWLGRGPSAREVPNLALAETFRAIHKDPDDVRGSPRVHAGLVAVHGMAASPKRVAALMAAADLVGVHRRKRRGLTKQDKKAPPAPDLVGRKLIGYAMAQHVRAELVVNASTMAAAHSQLADGAIFHSDRRKPIHLEGVPRRPDRPGPACFDRTGRVMS